MEGRLYLGQDDLRGLGILTTFVSACDVVDPCQEKLSGPQVAASPPPLAQH